MYSDLKAAQIAAYFLSKTKGSMPYLKLMKLMYLADRESYKRHGFAISGDSAVSMPHGPVLSQTLNLMQGTVNSDEWSARIRGAENYSLGLVGDALLTRDDFDELSDADLHVMDSTWAAFGHMDKWAIRDYTHTLPEWKNPQGSSYPIYVSSIFQALGMDRDESFERQRQVDSMNSLSRALCD